MSADPLGALRTLLDELPSRASDAGLVSLIATVAWRGDVVASAATGWADREVGIAASPTFPYPVASVTKSFTSTAVMVEVARGVMSLDDPIVDHTGPRLRAPFGDDPREVTVARLLEHTGGIPAYHRFALAGDPPPSLDEAIERYGFLGWPPGSRFEYSNLGFGMLGVALEAVTGTDLRSLLDDRVFEPLAMAASGLGAQDLGEGRIAARYDDAGVRYPADRIDDLAAGDGFASTEDLVRFGLLHLGHDTLGVLTTDAIDRLHQPTSVSGGGTAYGAGWHLRTVGGATVVGHDGEMPGVSALLWLVPALDLAIAVVANGDTSAHRRLATDVVRCCLPTGEGKEDATTPAPDDAAAPAALTRPGVWRGTIATDGGPRDIAVRTGQQPTAAIGGADERPLRDVRRRGGRLTGTLDGELATPDADRYPHTLELDLWVAGDELHGIVATGWPDDAPFANRVAYPATLREEG